MCLKLFKCFITTSNVENAVSNVSLSLQMYNCALQKYKHKQKKSGSSTDLNEICAYIIKQNEQKYFLRQDVNPRSLTWKASILPLNHTAQACAGQNKQEYSSTVCDSSRRRLLDGISFLVDCLVDYWLEFGRQNTYLTRYKWLSSLNFTFFSYKSRFWSWQFLLNYFESAEKQFFRHSNRRLLVDPKSRR